jgi:hypothetical protein
MQEVTGYPGFEVRQLSRAEENCLAIAGLVKRLHYDFLELGGLLLENQAQAFWSASGAESFKDFVQQLGISYDWATRLMGVAQAVVDNVFTKEEVVEIGVAKACLLLPHIRQGKLTEDMKLLARDASWNDLRKELGHNLIDPKDLSEYLLCPRCGAEIDLKPGMIKKR